MDKFNVITGLPRSGSTLLCNILNQNPEFHASTTSILLQLINNISLFWSNSPEVKGMLQNNRVETEEKLSRVLKGITKNWYNTDKVIFDKCRGWGSNSLLFNTLFNGLIICLVRDLRNVFASIEKQHRKYPVLDLAKNNQEKTIYDKADKMFSADGIIGMPILGIEDLIRRKPKNVMFIKYEELSCNPKNVMMQIYERLGIEYHEHDFEDIKNTAQDPDYLYLNKYPHEGSGKILPYNPNEWKAYVSEDLANTIMQRFPQYNSWFEYGGMA